MMTPSIWATISFIWYRWISDWGSDEYRPALVTTASLSMGVHAASSVHCSGRHEATFPPSHFARQLGTCQRMSAIYPHLTRQWS